MSDAIPLNRLYEIAGENTQIWEYDNEHEAEFGQDETWVFPVLKTPVDTLDNRLVVTKVTLANGNKQIGILGNISVNKVRSTEQFITLSIINNHKCFDLASTAFSKYLRNRYMV